MECGVNSNIVEGGTNLDRKKVKYRKGPPKKKEGAIMKEGRSEEGGGRRRRRKGGGIAN